MQNLPRFTKLAALGVMLALAGAPARSEAAGKCPNLHFIVDRSGSMATAFDGTTRWSAEVNAINKVLTKYDGKMPIGATLFTSGASCSPDPIIKPATGSKTAISMALAGKMPSGSSALGSAINPTVNLTELRDATRPNHLILITDGVPSCSGGLDTIDSALTDVRNAYMRTPSLTTYVMAFDDTITATDKTDLGRLADAGGKPFAGTKYYKIATSASFAMALEQLVDDLYAASGCDGGTPGDTCYEKGCARATDYCIRGVCAPNPCAGYTCPRGDYCTTDGVSAPTCVAPCPVGCPSGTRCKGDSCAPDVCGGPCGASKVCDKTTKTCKNDPNCFGITCKGTSKCMNGLCVDDPCDFITCPSGRRCVPWEGSCEVPSENPVADMSSGPTADMGSSDTPDLATGPDTMMPMPSGGCATTTPGSPSAATLASLAIAAFCLVTLRRRRAA